jgi:hypothetical protein
VLALRAIVEDTGVDRGFIVTEVGYQSGALEAARSANILLTSTTDLRETLAFDIGSAKLQAIGVRLQECRDRYWQIDKQRRIESGLRPDVGSGYGYRATDVMNAVEYSLTQILHGAI